MSEETARTKPPEREARAGTVIAGRYAVERLIARGGMASVYLASQVGLGRSVAVKVLSPPPDADEEASFEQRFRLEASTLAGLDHPNIVIVHDFGETHDGRYFIAMEYVNGPRLSDLLRSGPMEPERAARLMLQVCAAVQYAHRRGVVHRDLKPSNLLIRVRDGGEEQVKVVDFGLVKLAEHDQTLTRAGLILGSPHCMAPEQIRGLDVDHRADIYAIGVVLFRALTGKYPFHGENSTATMIAHLNEPIPSFVDRAEDARTYPERLEEVVLRCLAKQPEDRYDSVPELIESLAGCFDIPIEGYRFASQTHSTITRQTTAVNALDPIESAITQTGKPPRSVLLLAGLIGVGLVIALVVAVIALVVLLSQQPGLTGEQPVGPPSETQPVQPLSEPPSPEPAPEATPEPSPEPAVEAAPRPAPRPTTAPRPIVAPAPNPAPAPQAVQPAPTPVPSDATGADDASQTGDTPQAEDAQPVDDAPDLTPDTEAAPPGYYGIPEDF